MSQPESDEADAKTPGTTASEPPKPAEAEETAPPASAPTATKTASTPPGPPSEATPAEPADGAGPPASGELAVNGADAASGGPSPLEVARADALKFRDQLLRTAADFDNFRKRTRRELEDAQKKGTEKALKEMLPVFDNLERALQSAETAPDAKSVADGLRLVGRQFNTTLDKMGIKRVQTVGLPFDPMRHEAISHVESTEHPAGVVVSEVQAGYILGDFLLRAALVAVSAGPGPDAKPASDAEDAAPKDEPADN